MATVSQVTVFKIFLLLYLATRGLAIIEYGNNNGSSMPLELDCDNGSIKLNTTTNSNSYVLELISSTSTSTWCINEQLFECDHPACRHSIHLQIDNTACNNTNKMDENCTSSCTEIPMKQLSCNPIRNILIAFVAVPTVLLGIVIICWIGTYRTMKKRIRALQTTVTTAMPATVNSLTIDTNNEDPPNQQPLCFQNASYEQNSPGPSFSQSPARECPETNIYDLPFQAPAGVSKEIPKPPPETLPKSTGSMRYKAQDPLPKGSLRYTAHKPRSLEPPGESKNIGQGAAAPESPRMKEIEFSCSINEQQWIPVNEYEVPITQQETQN